MKNKITIGSLFAGIGGFELGLERAIPNSQTIWQVEQNKFCQSILQKHWPDSKIFDDVCSVGAHNLPPVDILCGGFPCQDISHLGRREGLNGKKSGLWYQMHRIICELRPRIIILENVATIIIRGLPRILGGLSELGYDAEWKIITASQFGAPHQRKRWFLVAYANSRRLHEQPAQSKPMEKGPFSACRGGKNGRLYIRNHWKQTTIPKSVVRVVDDGISDRVAAFRALGNAIVPQCAEYVGLKLLNSGLLDDLI